MSKKDKLLGKLLANPPPKGFTWDDLLVVMTRCGFSHHCSGGSHYIFEHTQTGLRLSISKTHPSGVLKGYQVQKVKEVLETIGATNESK